MSIDNVSATVNVTPELVGTVDQIGFVVADIEAAMRYWTRVLGVGPFYYHERSASKNLFYRGERIDMVSSTALAQAGGVQVELIQQRDDVPNVYRDMNPNGPGSLHHVGRFVDDYTAEVEAHVRAGAEIVQEGDAGPTVRFCYLADPAGGGPLLEIIEIGALRGYFDKIAQDADKWDGTDPVRVTKPSF